MIKVEVADSESMASNALTSSKSTELIAFNENQEIQYQGYCKLQINTVSKFLKVNPVNENFRDITATFDWKFIKQKNIIFVFAKLVSQDFALIFNDEEKCQKVFNGIFKKRDNKDSVDKEILEERFLIPIFKKIPKNGYSRLKVLMRKWIRKHDNEIEKKKYFKLLNEHQNQEMNDIKNVKQEFESEPNTIARKRKHHELQNNNNNVAAECSSNSVCEGSFVDVIDLTVDEDDNEVDGGNGDEVIYIPTKKAKIFSSDKNTKIIDESMFKIVNLKYHLQNRICRKLLIFTSSSKTRCYEYNYYSKKQMFYHRCQIDCRSGIKAALKLDVNGNECIKVEDKKHICSPLKYDPERYNEMKILKKPNYEIIENSATKTGRMLFIFDSNDRNLCYEYFWSLHFKKFQCSGCCSKRKKMSAEIFHENTEAEYIRLINDKHFCQIRKYNPEKFNQLHKYVLSPNFEIHTKIQDGKERKTLIIFDENDRKLCYKYFFGKYGNLFYCCGCSKKRKNVTAKICQNSNGEDYILLLNSKHVCTLRPCQITLRPPAFKFVESNGIFTSKLYIFDLNNPKLCYTFSTQNYNSNRYHCLGCANESKNKKNFSQGKHQVSAFLYKDDSKNDDEYYIKMLDDQKHRCKPVKYEPEKYERKILKPKEDYILFRKTGRMRIDYIYVAVFCTKDKKLCYQFCYNKNGKDFYCSKCSKKNHCIRGMLRKNLDGNENFVIKDKKHLCQPVKYSSLIDEEDEDIVILENSSLFFEKEEPQKAKKKEKEEIDESRIIRLPNFELQRNTLGVPERKLVLFIGENRKMCYIYHFSQGENKFVCNKCKAKAKLQSNGENGEKYVILGENEHSCEPVKYESDVKIIEAPDFLIFYRDDETKLTKLILFTSSQKDMCYEYIFNKGKNNFHCCGCLTSYKKKVTVKLLKNANGKEFIQLSKINHFCEPIKFILEDFQPKTVAETEFKLFSNKNGKPNSKLILFDPQKDGFCFEYFMDNKNLFRCNHCDIKKKRVTLRLCENKNGEKYLELSKEKHICKSTKYDPKKFADKKIIYENFYLQHHIKSGNPESRLTILNENNKNLGYQYFLDQNKNTYYCSGCKTIAKLLIDEENGKQFVEFGIQEHCCKIKNFKEKKMVFDEFKFEESGKVLITTTGRINYKFKLDEKLDAFCCVKCKGKKKFITATICKNKSDGKEFVLLNDSHCCGAFI